MDPYAPTPEELQSVLASTIRGREQLTQNNERANRFGNMSAIAQLANNPDAARAAIAAHENAQKEYKPVQMGQTGFTLPGTGEFVENPIYAEQRLVDKGEKRQALAETMQARKDAQAERLAAQQQMQADRLAAQSRENGLYRTLASVAQANREAAAAAKAEAASAAANKPPARKLLSGSEIRKLTEQEGIAAGMADLTSSFKPELSGTTGIAGLENIVGKYNPLGMGESLKEQSNWWQNYNEQKNLIRNKLFGSALTRNEEEAFNRATISEGMDPGQIAERLAQQSRAAALAYNKLKANHGKGGYYVDEYADLPVPEAKLPGGGVRKASGVVTPAAAPSDIPAELAKQYPNAKITRIK